MDLIIGSLALVVAIVALWFVSISMKKIEAIGDNFTQGIQNELRQASDKVNAKIEKLEKQNLKIAKKLESLTKEEN